MRTICAPIKPTSPYAFAIGCNENASESDEAEETSSECGAMDIDDSEPELDKSQDVDSDFKEEDEDEDEQEEDDEESDDAPSYDAGITIPENYAARYDGGGSVDKCGCYTLDAGTAGELKQDFIQDPYEEVPYNIIITDIEDVSWEDLKITSIYGRPKDAWNGYGLEGELELEGALEGCGTDKAFGSIKMRPVWRKVGTDGKPMEFFEGSLIFERSLNPIFAKKARVQGSRESFDFWAIRAVP